MYMLDEIREQPAVLRASFARNIETIRSLAARLNGQKVCAVAIAARGTSDHAAIYGKYCIEILVGRPVGLAAPSVTTLYGGDVDYSNMLVLGISQSGKAEDVREVLRSAQKRGAVTVAITNDEESPVAREAAIHLPCSAGPEKSVAATKTFTSQLYILGLLAACWGGREDIVEELRALPDALEEYLKGIGTIIGSAERYKFADSCFVLARGLLYPVAMEAALKIQETTYTAAKAYAVSDFWHGPLAMVEKNTPVILFAGSDAAQKDAAEMAAKLRTLEADILMVTDTEKATFAANHSLIVPAAHPIAAPFFYAVTAQVFAYGLAIHKGLNPDSPRSLKKVTITK